MPGMKIVFLKKHASFLLALFLILYGALLYSNTLTGDFHFDDDYFIVDNGLIRSPSHLKELFFFWPTRFIVFLSFSLNYYVHQLHVAGYHIVNIAIHVGVSLLVWWFLSLLLKTPALKKESCGLVPAAGAFFSALIFLAHPLQTESVAYIYQRAASLSALFYLLTLCFYIRGRISVPEKKIFYILAWMCCLLGMLAKENVFTLPAMIILCELYFFKTGRRIRWKPCLFFLPLLFVVPVLLLWFKPETFKDIQRIIDLPVSSFLYCLTQPRVIVTYMRLLLVPVNQNLEYDHPFFQSVFEPSVILSVSFIIFLLFLCRRLFSRQRLLSFGLCWFFVTLLPESSFIPLRDLIFEHRLYLPMMGFAVFISFGLISLFPQKRIKWAFLILSVLTAFYGVLTFQRNKVWSDDLLLWNDVVKKSPYKTAPLVNRAIALNARGFQEEALEDINKVIAAKPDFVEAYNVRGCIFFHQARYPQALKDFDQASALEPQNREVLLNRGILFYKMGRYDDAIKSFHDAIARHPYYIKAYSSLASLYVELGRVNDAITVLLKAGDVDSFNAQIYSDLAFLFGQKRDFQKSLFYAKKALDLNPRYAPAYLTQGVAYGFSGAPDKAIVSFKKSVELEPRMALGYYNLAVMYYYSGNCKEARRYYDKIQATGQRFNPVLTKLIQKCDG